MASPTSTLKLIRHPTYYELWRGDKLSFSKELNNPIPKKLNLIYINDGLYRLEIICERRKLFMVQTDKMFDVYQLSTGGIIRFIKRYENERFFGYFSDLGILVTSSCVINPYDKITFYHIFSGELAHSVRMFCPHFMRDYIVCSCEPNDDGTTQYHIFRLYYENGTLQHNYELKPKTNLLNSIYGNTKDYLLNIVNNGPTHIDNPKSIGGQTLPSMITASFINPLTQTIVEEVVIYAPGFYQAASYNFDGNGIIISTKPYGIEIHHAIYFRGGVNNDEAIIEENTQKQVYTNSQIILAEDDDTKHLKQVLNFACGLMNELVEIIMDYYF